MENRIPLGFNGHFYNRQFQHQHLFPSSASSTDLSLFRPFQSTPVLLPPLAPMPLLAHMRPMPSLAPMPHSLFPAASSGPGWGNFQTAGILSSNHLNVSSSSIGHPSSGRAKVRMGFSIEDILNSDHAQPTEINRVSIPSSNSSAFHAPVSMSSDGEPTTSDIKKDRELAWQHEQLELAFQQSHYPEKERKLELSQAIGMTEKKIAVWFQNRRALHRKMNQTQRGPGRPSLANPPSTCSGVPIPDEEFQRKRRERAEKRKQYRAKKYAEKIKQRGTGTDVTAGEFDDEEPRMMKTESDLDQGQGSTSSNSFASPNESLWRHDVISSGINAPALNPARSVDENSGVVPRESRPSFTISNIIG